MHSDRPECPEVPNLDGMFQDDVQAWWEQHKDKPAATIFPRKPKGYIGAFADLLSYAYNKSTAMQFRIGGDIPQALKYEEMCDRIYNRLPAYAKW